MRAMISALLFLAATGSALAQRPSTTRMACQAAAGIVAQRGAVVLGTGGDTYDRFVANETLCLVGTYARPAFVPTRDTPQCYVGFYCSNSPPMFGR